MQFGWPALLALIAVPAILVAALPRRALLGGIVLWLLSPVAAYVALVTWEAFTRPTVKDPVGTALYGFMLISPILLLPWLLVCGAGFALGFGARAVLRPRRAPAPAPAKSAATLPAVPASPREPDPDPSWRHVHIGFDNDDLRIGGLHVWKQRWRPAGAAAVLQAHPTHPSQTHRYDVYEIGPAAAPIRFAAGELSNGVWGFSVHQDDPALALGTSADGTLRYEHPAAGANPAARLIDAATGQVIVDGTGWEFSRITPNADGTMFLLLRQAAFDVMFRIDPASRQCWNHGEAGPKHGLDELPTLVDAALAAAGRIGGAPASRHISPDAAIRVDLISTEWANTHWVNAPRVIRIPSDAVVLDLWGTDWDAAVSFPRTGRVRLALRRYRGGAGIAVEIDAAHGTYRIGNDPAPLAGIAAGLDAAWAAASAYLPARPTVPVNRFAAWRAALLIAAGAFIAIAGATYLSVQAGGGTSQRTSAPLTKMPEWPR